jgi:hypothetical protein
LYQKQIPEDEPFTFVQVINYTPEPSGTWTWERLEKEMPLVARRIVEKSPVPLNVLKESNFKEYFLRVHPECRPIFDDRTMKEVEKGVAPRVRYGDPQEMTAHNAAASLVSLRGEEYDPDVQS